MQGKQHSTKQKQTHTPSIQHVSSHTGPQQSIQRQPAPPHAYQRVSGSGQQQPTHSPADMLTLQRCIGNQAVQRLVARTAQRDAEPIQRKANNTGLPDRLKAGVESLSRMSMGDVRVHYNSSKPAQLQALAYTKGTDIHVGPGQERHLAHEAWHVVQQKQGRVQPTLQMKGAAINDNRGLEREADVMGAKAIQMRRRDPSVTSLFVAPPSTTSESVIQRVMLFGPRSYLFKMRKRALLEEIHAIVQKIINVDPNHERDLLTENEALEIATEVVRLKSLAETESSVKNFYIHLGTFTSNYQGEQGRNLYQYLNGIDTRDCGATTVHVFLQVWNAIKDKIKRDESEGEE